MPGGNSKNFNRSSSLKPMVLYSFALLSVLLWNVPARAASDRIVTRGTFTLEFKDLTGKADQAVADRMIDTYFAVYPQLVADFYPAGPRRVTFVIDPTWTGIAATVSSKVMFNPDWLTRHPEDIDDVTHELMHVLQDLGRPNQPRWLIEGMADYAREVYGVDNAGARWSLPYPGPLSRYTEGYRTAARFLLWEERHDHPGLVRSLLDVMRRGKYRDKYWAKLTGRPLDVLWSDYVKTSQPVIIRRGPPPTPEQLEQARRIIEQLQAQVPQKSAPGVPAAPATGSSKS